MTTYLIATGVKPKQDVFIPHLVELAKAEGVDIKAVLICEGPGCANIAFMLDEPNERFVNALTMGLMPAKWETTDDPAIQPGMFEDRLER